MNPTTHALLDALIKIAMLVVSVLATVYTPVLVGMIRTRVQNATVREALASVVVLTGKFVTAQANTVRELKDPLKPGLWDKNAAMAALAHVTEQIKAAAPSQLFIIESGLAAGQSLDAVLHALIEADVETLRRQTQIGGSK